MMNDAPNLFNPRDDSLAEKVNAYYGVCRDYSRVQSSLKQTEQGKNIHFIGDHSEVMSAYEAISQSLAHASKEVSSADLQHALEEGYLSQEQTHEILTIKRSHELALKRSVDTHRHQSSSEAKR